MNKYELALRELATRDERVVVMPAENRAALKVLTERLAGATEQFEVMTAELAGTDKLFMIRPNVAAG